MRKLMRYDKVIFKKTHDFRLRAHDPTVHNRDHKQSSINTCEQYVKLLARSTGAALGITDHSVSS